MSAINIENNISIRSADIVVDVSRHFLQRYDLTHFCYARYYKDNSCFALSTHPGMAVDFHKQQFYNVTDFEIDFSQTEFAYLLWICGNAKEQELISFAREKHHYSNGIVLIYNKGQYQEQVYFAADINNYAANNFYINNIDLLERFNHIFLDKAENIIADCHEQRIYMPERKNIGSNDKYRRTYSRQHGYMVGTETLSRRETQILYYLKGGLSCQNIAERLDLKVKTIYFYLDNLKKKLGLRKKDELLNYYSQHVKQAMWE